MGTIILIVFVCVVLNAWYNPNTSSTSYRLGKGLGSKTRRLGDWIMKD